MLNRTDRTNCICFGYEYLGILLKMQCYQKSTAQHQRELLLNLRCGWDYFGCSCNCYLFVLLYTSDLHQNHIDLNSIKYI